MSLPFAGAEVTADKFYLSVNWYGSEGGITKVTSESHCIPKHWIDTLPLKCIYDQTARG